jgi:hypothetical protein
VDRAFVKVRLFLPAEHNNWPEAVTAIFAETIVTWLVGVYRDIVAAALTAI